MSDTLIISISGVRGIVGKDLTPDFVARYAAAFGSIVAEPGKSVVLGRDSRTSGELFSISAAAGLRSVGCNVIDLGIVPTPTTQLAVEHHHAAGGIVITASHNPIEWNALKLVGPDGVFLDVETGERVKDLAAGDSIERVGWDGVGHTGNDHRSIERHIEQVFALPYVDTDAVIAKGTKVALDCVRGAGGKIIPRLLKELGCEVFVINGETDGKFPRAPEPIPANLGELSQFVTDVGADIGMAVDPDVDRLAIVDETGRPIGEDYTLAFAVESVLERNPGNVVVNLSTSQIIDDVVDRFDAALTRSPVGEANVARVMREKQAVIGGEGNGGVILPELHLGRDAPLGVSMILDLLARTNAKVSELVDRSPRYVIVKDKGPRTAEVEPIYDALEARFDGANLDKQDGLRLTWDDKWLHVRPSGTEPIVRMIAEAPTQESADSLVLAAREVLDSQR
jgi:phosphomannomutase